eukprot:8542713-Alexandrium_andersonii.AAC.1
MSRRLLRLSDNESKQRALGQPSMARRRCSSGCSRLVVVLNEAADQLVGACCAWPCCRWDRRRER